EGARGRGTRRCLRRDDAGGLQRDRPDAGHARAQAPAPIPPPGRGRSHAGPTPGPGPDRGGAAVRARGPVFGGPTRRRGLAAIRPHQGAARLTGNDPRPRVPVIPTSRSDMPVRVVVNRAGTGAGNNLIRSLRAAGRSVHVIGCHHDPFVLRKSAADTSFLLPRTEPPPYTEALCHDTAAEQADLFLPHTDDDVHFASRLRDTLPCRVFLPPHDVIELCQDKYRLNAF